MKCREHRGMERFLTNRMAVVGLFVFVLSFAMVILLPVFYPLKLSAQEVTQQNIAPGRKLMAYPKELEGNVKQISVGATFSVGMDETGTLFLWGQYPPSVGRIPEHMGRIRMVSAGTNHVLALNEEGKVFAWGSNRFHQLDLPKEIMESNDITQIVAGNQFSIAVTGQGKVYFWGNQNLIDYVPTTEQTNVRKVAVNTSTVLALLQNGIVTALGRRDSGLTRIPDMTGIVDLAMTAKAAYALKEDGTVYRWGSKEEVLSVPYRNEQERLISIQAGRTHVTGLSNLGTVYCWGENTFGQTKIPKSVERQPIMAVYTGFYQNYAVTDEGKLLTWGLKGYLMGTDGYGRDLFTRLIHGGRLTMTIGAVAVILQSLIGVVFGQIAGYYGGKIDDLLMRFAEVINSLPFLPFAMILSAFLGNRLSQMQRIFMIMVILGFLSWPGMARLVRAQVLEVKNQEFVMAAKAVGIHQMRIIFRHILPNVMSYVLVSATGSFAASMLTESSLSFLGFGVTEPNPTWGNMLTGSQSSVVIGTYWWRWVFPALALSLTTISINLIGDGLRDAIDPKSTE